MFEKISRKIKNRTLESRRFFAAAFMTSHVIGAFHTKRINGYADSLLQRAALNLSILIWLQKNTTGLPVLSHDGPLTSVYFFQIEDEFIS